MMRVQEAGGGGSALRPCSRWVACRSDLGSLRSLASQHAIYQLTLTFIFMQRESPVSTGAETEAFQPINPELLTEQKVPDMLQMGLWPLLPCLGAPGCAWQGGCGCVQDAPMSRPTSECVHML